MNTLVAFNSPIVGNTEVVQKRSSRRSRVISPNPASGPTNSRKPVGFRLGLRDTGNRTPRL